MDHPAEQLIAGDFTEASEPFALFEQWLAEARTKEINDPDAMALSTVDADGLPNVRMVLCRDFDSRGPVFYTNAESAKGQELLTAHKAAALFHWKSLRRQVRIRGPVEVVDEAQSDRYFNGRPRDSRIGAWASQQSRPLESRFALEKAVAKYAAKYAVGDVPRPPYWKGFRIRPLQFEFWSDGAFRLHNRIDFRREAPDGDWRKQRLYP